MSCYGEVRRGGDRKRDRQEALQSTIVIEAIPRYPPQRVLRAAVIPRGGPEERRSISTPSGTRPSLISWALTEASSWWSNASCHSGSLTDGSAANERSQYRVTCGFPPGLIVSTWPGGSFSIPARMEWGVGMYSKSR